MLRLALLLAGAAPLGLPALQGPAQAQEPGWETARRDVPIPMRDGKTLAANVLLPDEPGRYPAILVQTPYDKNRMGREVGDLGRRSEVGRGSQRAWAQFDREHYAYVFVDWRGFFASKPAMEGVNRRRWRRGQDGYDCVEWIAAQPWCDGEVGTWGGSALGKQQFDTAAEQPPHLVCSVPLIAYQGSRYEAYYEGGVQLEAHTKNLNRLGFGIGSFPAHNPLPGTRVWTWVRNRTYAPGKIEVPCLMISGWWDNYPREVVEMFEDVTKRGGPRARTGSKLIMGPWSHTAIDVPEQGDLEFPEAEDYSTRVTLAFFDYHLRGIEDDDWGDVPAVHVFQTNEGKWISGESWDDLIGEKATYYLLADGGIAREAPAGATEDGPLTRTYTYDPQRPSPTLGGRNLMPLTHGPKEVTRLGRREDVLVYETAPLEEPLAIRGEVALSLSFRCNRVDTDIHVRLCDTFADGRSYLVGETIQRAKLRDGSAVQELEPDRTYRVTLRLHPHAYTWRKGHELQVLLSGGSSPRYERNPNTGADHWNEAQALDVEVTVFHDIEQRLELELPLVTASR